MKSIWIKKYNVFFKDRVHFTELKSALPFSIAEGKKNLKEKYPDCIKIEYVKSNRKVKRLWAVTPINTNANGA